MNLDNFIDFNENKEKITEKIKSTNGLVVVDFMSPTCSDCRRLAAGLPSVVKAHPDVLFLAVDVSKVETARDDWDIQHIPDVRFYKGSAEHIATIVEGLANQVEEKIRELK
ncbi:Thioredoxin [Tritrichomonas foetus]|uniref:Thioredoxin n=1 Tax=Tritrichomonas foetus TaxID=1144522 RepID=A0A1J4JSE2_9EUKA|nr:Thioredoxin [Tritrichomonas foetus]|eukprot:OHT02025.1 Thioredoxin [Tritrichomonas foetus]